MPSAVKGLVALLAAAAATMAIAAAYERQRMQALRQATISVQERPDNVADSAAAAFRPPPYESSAREFLGAYSWPWPDALAAIESAKVRGVRLVSIELSASTRTVRLEARYTEHPQLLEYLTTLNLGEPEQRWFLVSAHTEPSSGSTAAIVRESR